MEGVTAALRVLVWSLIVVVLVTLGAATIVHGLRTRHRYTSLLDRFNWSLGVIVMGLSLIVWPPLIALRSDDSTLVAWLVGAAATFAAGAGLAGQAQRSRWPWP